MISSIVFKINSSTIEDVQLHLSVCDNNFFISLSDRVDINSYSKKIYLHAERYEAWFENKLIGLIAIYTNNIDKFKAHITSVSVLPDFQNQKIASELLSFSIGQLRLNGIKIVDLEVFLNHKASMRLYAKFGFQKVQMVEEKKILDRELSIDKNVVVEKKVRLEKYL